MNQLGRLAVAAALLAGTSATADVREHMREAIELAGTIESTAHSMTAKIPRTCRILRRDAKEARGTADAERIGDALEHCRRAMDALNNGMPKHAEQRLRRMIVVMNETPSPQ